MTESHANSKFEIIPLKNLTEAEEASFKTRGLPGHPPLRGPEGQFFGHEWSRWLFDTLDQRLDQLLEIQSPSGASILDLGCATGARSGQFAQAGHKVTALDVVDQAKEIQSRNDALIRDGSDAERVQPITFVQADIRDTCTASFARTFDVVHARRVLNFIPLRNLPGLVDVVRATLKTGGLFVASFISTEVTPSQMHALRPLGSSPILTLYPGLFGHYFGEIYQLLQDHGLTIVEGFSDFQVEVGLIARKSPQA